MTASHISSSAIGMASRLSIMALQNKLQVAQKEMSTARLADPGLDLGFRIGETVSMRQEVERLQGISDTNGIAKGRLESSDVALKGIADAASQFLGNIFLAKNNGITSSALAGVAKNTLEGFTDAVNTTLNGQFLFSGINSDVKAVNTYFSVPASPAQNEVAAEFQSAFGFTQADPAVKTITGPQMQAFLDGPFANIFDTNWNTNWSSATDQTIKSRISSSELISTSTTANEPAFRKLAQAYTMLSDLGNANLSEDAYRAILDKSVGLITEASTDLTRIRTDVGSTLSRISSANDRISIQVNVLNLNVQALEGVDPAEVSTRVSALLTQIETAYAVTARIQNLSILKFMPQS